MTVGLHKLYRVVGRKKRLGRGIGSKGACSGKGMKGQKSRAGYKRRAGFEGGQTPLYQRLPKGRGTKQVFRSQVKKMVAVRVSRLNKFDDGSIIGLSMFRKLGLTNSRRDLVKLIGGGGLNKALTVRVNYATSSAEKTVQKAGGKVEIIGQ